MVRMLRSRRGKTRLLALLVLLVATGLLAAYRYVTSPSRLRARVLDVLADRGFAHVDVAHVRFSLRDGLLLSGISVGSVASGPANNGEPAVPTPRLYVGSARLACDMAPLLAGMVRPRTVTLDHVRATVVAAPPDAQGEPVLAQADDGAEWLQRLVRQTAALPALEIRDLDLQILSADGGHARVVERYRLRAIGRAKDGGYGIQIDRRAEAAEPFATLHWSTATERVRLTLDAIDLNLVRRFASGRISRHLERMGLEGTARVDQVVFGPAVSSATALHGERVDLTLRNARFQLDTLGFALPVVGERPTRSDAACYLKIRDAGAVVTYRGGGNVDGGELAIALQGQLNGAPLQVNATLADAPFRRVIRGESITGSWNRHLRSARIRVQGLALPTHESHAAFVNSEQLPGALVAALDDYRPSGPVNVDLRVLPAGEARDAADTGGRVRGTVEALGCTCEYIHFPYGFENIRGSLELVDGRVLLHDLEGRHGVTRAHVRGSLNNTYSWTGFSLTFYGHNVALNEDLYRALPEEYRRLWRDAAPIGACDAVVRVGRDEGSAELGALPPSVHVEAQLLGGSMSLDEAQRIDHVDGHLSVSGEVLEIHDLHGFAGKAEVRLAGEVQTGPGALRTDLRVQINGHHFDERIELASAGAGGEITSLRLEGAADVWGHVWEAPASGEPQQRHLAVRIRDATLHTLDPQQHWADGQGWVLLHADRQEILGFACQQGAARLRASGVLPGRREAGQPILLTLSAKAPDVDGLCRQFVPTSWIHLVDKIGLQGSGRIRLELHPAQDPETGLRQAAQIEIEAEGMRGEPLPLHLRAVDATLALTPGRFNLRASEARWGEQGQITVTGSGNWQKDDLHATFDIDAQGMTFAPDLIAALPTPVARILDELAVQGDFNALLHTVRIAGREQRRYELDGRIELEGVALRLGFPLDELRGALTGRCDVSPDGAVRLDGEIDLQRGRIAKRAFERWHGTLTYLPDEGWVRIDDVSIRLCGGEAQGHLWIDTDTSAYEIELTMQDVILGELLPPEDPEQTPPSEGLITGRVWLRGTAGDVQSRVGGGRIVIRGASLVRTPVLASVARDEHMPRSARADAVDRAELEFIWTGRDIRLQHVDIRSPHLRLVGKGSWNLRSDRLDLTLFGAPQNEDSPIPVITEWLIAVGNDLVRYRVTGSRKQPKVTAEPLPRVADALRLFQPAAAE